MRYLYKYAYDDKEIYEDVYQKRYNAETTLRTGLTIKPYKTNKEFELYYIFNSDTLNYIDTIMQNDITLSELKEKLPLIAKQRYFLDLISDELISTNKLEGVDSTKQEIIETAKMIQENKANKDKRHYSMTYSYIILGDELLGLEHKEIRTPKNLKDIRTIHDRLTRGEINEENMLDGELFRRDAVNVQKRGTVSAEIIHQGINGEENIKKVLSVLLDFMNNDDIHLLLRVAIAHYYFGYIHPFYDGNGRVGRFISSIYLESKYSYLTSMSLSQGILLGNRSYYDAFHKTNSKENKGELNYFVDTFLQFLIDGQKETIFNLNNKYQRLERAKEKIDTYEVLNKIEREILYYIALQFFFNPTPELERDEVLTYMKDKGYGEFPTKNSLKNLEEQGYIRKYKSRPLIYGLDPQSEIVK